VLGRLVAALDARRRAGGGPVAVVPCDNLADNAGVIRSAIADIADRVDPALAGWIETHVSFVNTCVDRITPATTAADIAEVARERGYRDNAAVVAEPFHEWVLCGDFPAGRPAWERAGAQFVADIRPYETRKLWFLNGAHSLMAYLGQSQGLSTVDEAIRDPHCRRAVDALWDLAKSQLRGEGLDLPTYRTQLLERFANRRISHRLAQIALDGSVKLRNRVVPLILVAEPGTDLRPALAVLAAWIDYLATLPAVTTSLDPAAAEIAAALALEPSGQTRALLTVLVPSWRDDEELQTAVHVLRQLSRSPS
jgi:fructuronate reductase